MDLATLKDIAPWDWPIDVGTQLLDYLRNPQADAADRLLAAELAGETTVINDDIAEALLTIVRSAEETDDLREMAAVSLGPGLEHADIMGFDDPDDILISEEVCARIQEVLHALFLDTTVPQAVRRQILEASVRAPLEWHEEAIRTAYDSDEDDWRLTAVFCMRFIRGFDALILEALDNEDQDIHYQAICAAGNWEVDAAWAHVVALVTDEETEKDLLLAAIEAVASIRPHEASEMLIELTESEDDDIVEAAFEALGMVEELTEHDGDEEDDDKYF